MLKPLMQSPTEVGETIQAATRRALFLDFDGTLTPIVADPAIAQLSSGTRDALRQIELRSFIVIAIISGRRPPGRRQPKDPTDAGPHHFVLDIARI
jgi:trehalose-6-phosphatase